MSTHTPAADLWPAPLSRIRRNHGLEHATLRLLAPRFPGKPMGGLSDAGGFWLLADVPALSIEETAQQALAQMRAGAHHLAIHPNCGTNLLTAGLLTTLSGAAILRGPGSKQQSLADLLPLALMASVAGLVLAQPLGFWLQRFVTTSGVPGNLRVISVESFGWMGLPLHRVTTQDGLSA